MSTAAKLALPDLFDQVSALMTSEAGEVTAIATRDFAGTAAPNVTGPATAPGQAAVRFTTGGTVGMPGIMYQTSVDAGATWSAVVALGTALVITLLGCTLALATGGTVIDGDVVSWEANDPTNPPHVFGWREPTHRSGALRVVWEPGEDGNLGDITPTRGNDPRSLATLVERFTIHCEARDASTPMNERAQYEAARRLFNAVWRAVYATNFGVVKLISMHYVSIGGGANPLGAVSQAGVTIRAVMSIESVIPDAPLAVASTSTDAHVSTTAAIDGVHDATDVEDVHPGDTP